MIFTVPELRELPMDTLCKLWIRGKAFEIDQDGDYLMFGTYVPEALYRAKYAEYEAYKKAIQTRLKTSESFGMQVINQIVSLIELNGAIPDSSQEEIARVLDHMKEYIDEADAVIHAVHMEHNLMDIAQEIQHLLEGFNAS